MRRLSFLRFGLIPAVVVLPGWALISTTTTCLAPDMASFGEPVNITASVIGADGSVPAGGIAVSDGAAVIATPVLTSNGTAKVTATFALGAHVISCSFAGDSTFAPSMSAASMMTVNPATPKIILNPSQNPVPAGQRVTIDIQLVAAGGAPSGSVTLLDGTTVLVVLPLLQEQDDSVAQFTTTAFAPGTHQISATYDGDGFFAAATTAQPLTLIVGRHATNTVILSASSGLNGQPIAVKVQVTSDTGTPTGTVSLTEGSKAATITLGTGTLSGGAVSILLTGLTLGTHSIVATYGGDANFDASSSAPIAVAGTASLTSILLAGTPIPVQVGQQVTLTATVTSPAGTPGGAVTFQGAQSVLGTANLNSAGQAVVTTSFAVPGTQAITAAYAGNSQFAPSTSTALALTVVPKQLAILSAASGTAPVAPDSLVSIYGDNLAAGPVSAALLPWPTTLGGASVVFRDATGAERLAALKFVSAGQINAVVPPDMPTGAATVVVRNGNVDVESGAVIIADTAPSLFSADGSGKGASVAYIQVFRANGTQTFQPTARCDGHGNCTTVPIDLGSDGDVAVMSLFGTGIRRGGASAHVLIGTQVLTPTYAGPQPQYGGVDQVNVTLPAVLRGAGEVAVVVTIADQVSNTVTVRFQ
ncbi:MAG TPA: Ig-like domain repeat protein [Bryobacteraceae bacterium]|nr:Ig-like domain repeat protein [Bryobacteraceae bacterium]